MGSNNPVRLPQSPPLTRTMVGINHMDPGPFPLLLCKTPCFAPPLVHPLDPRLGWRLVPASAYLWAADDGRHVRLKPHAVHKMGVAIPLSLTNTAGLPPAHPCPCGPLYMSETTTGNYHHLPSASTHSPSRVSSPSHPCRPLGLEATPLRSLFPCL